MFILILLIGFGLLINGVYSLSVRIKSIPMSKTITGTIIDLHETSIKRGTAYYPVIQYMDPVTNATERFEHNIGNGRSKYKIGDKLELRYYKGENRKLVLINTFSGIWGAPIAFIIAGAVFTVFGLLMVLS